MQKLSAIISDGNLTAPSANVVNSSKNSGDFQKIMTDMKNSGNGKNVVEGKTGTAKKKNAVINQTNTCGNPDDKVSQITQNASQKSDVSQTDSAAESFTKNDFLQAEEEVRSIVEDVLGLDEDILQQTLASMGITVMQLLDPKVLQQFVVQVNGGNDVTDLLTNENMMQQFSELSAGLLDINWEELTGLTGEQLSDMSADQFDDSELLQNLIDQLEGTAVADDGAVSVTEDVSQADVQIVPEQKENQIKETFSVSGDTPESILTESSPDASNVVADNGENVNRQVMAENTVLSEEAVQDNVKVTNEDVVPVAANSGENSSDAGAEDLMQNAFRNGEETAGQSGNPTSYFEDSPVAVTGSQTIMNFVENLVQASNVEQVQEPVNMQQMIDIVNQVVERVHSSLQDETTTLEMQLNPERLGKMLLTVNSRDGVMTASITVQNAEAKAALESQMITLRENLEQKNLKVEAVEVSVSDFAFSQSGQTDTGDQKNFRQGNGKRSRFRFDSDEEETDNQEETAQSVRRSIMPDSGSSVDFTA